MKKMRKLLRFFVVTIFCLWLTNSWFPEGLRITGGLLVLVKAGLALTLANLFVRPVVNLLLLPFNLITLGMFRWVVNAGMLWLVVRLVSGMSVAGFHYPGFTYQGFVIPGLQLSLVGAYIFLAFFISLVSTLLLWLFR
jgi:putative membrane protein